MKDVIQREAGRLMAAGLFNIEALSGAELSATVNPVLSTLRLA